MSDLILTEFDLQEFNEWMLTIQKASEDLNYILKKIRGMGYEKITLNELLKNPRGICKEILSEKNVLNRIFEKRQIGIFDLENPDYDNCLKEVRSKSIRVAHLRKRLLRVYELLVSYGFKPEDLFEEENGKVVISQRVEHSYFSRNASYLNSGEEALSILYDICDSLMKLKQHKINLHVLQNLLVSEERYKVNAARKSKVDDNTAKMQSIKQLGV